MKTISDAIYFMFILILVYLLVANWKGANALLSGSFSGTSALVKTLQGR
jgi:hypothetical protein